MPGVVLNEPSSTDNPALPFFYQQGGILLDVAALRFEIFEVGQAVAAYTATVDLVNDKLATGYYVAVLDPVTAGLSAGAHEIVWYYKYQLTDSEKLATYKFEVIDPTVFRTAGAYVGYISSADLTDTIDLSDRLKVINRASRDVERITGRFFFPKYLDLLASPLRDQSRLWLDEPIIGVNGLQIETQNVVLGTLYFSEIDMSMIRIFNRHLTHLLSPDDRQNPKIEFAKVGHLSDFFSFKYFLGGPQTIRVSGAFGYTDPDGTPFGQTPEPLADVVKTLALKALIDPTGTDIVLQNPARVKSAKTRDQAVSFYQDTVSSGAESSGSTGDSRLDNILESYMRPAHVEVV